MIERYPSFLIIKINPPPLPRHFSPKSQLVSVWRRRGGGRGGRGGGSGVVRILSRNVLLMRFNTLLLKGLFPLRRRIVPCYKMSGKVKESFTVILNGPVSQEK